MTVFQHLYLVIPILKGYKKKLIFTLKERGLASYYIKIFDIKKIIVVCKK